MRREPGTSRKGADRRGGYRIAGQFCGYRARGPNRGSLYRAADSACGGHQPRVALPRPRWTRRIGRVTGAANRVADRVGRVASNGSRTQERSGVA